MNVGLIGFILQAVIFLAVLFKLYTDMQVRFKEIELRIHAVERRDDEMFLKLDKIMDKISAIDVKMENKANR